MLRRSSGRYICAGLLFAVCSSLSVPAAQASRAAHVPDWVKAAAGTPLPPHQPRDAAAVLLDQQDIVVNSDGIATVHHRMVLRILTAAGRAFGEDDLAYPSEGKVHYLHAWTIGADGHEYEQDDKEAADVSAVADFEVYDSERTRIAHALAPEPGATVAFESEITESRNTSAWLFTLDGEIPNTGSTITLTLPAGFSKYTAWTRMAAVEPVSTGPLSWRWQLPARPAVMKEKAAPIWGDLTGRMLLSYAGPRAPASDGSWPVVGNWFAGLAAGRTDPSPAMQAEVSRLLAGKPGFVDRLQAIAGFLQDNIRYVAVEMGIGGWQPHAAAEVFAHQYGDCKDKATLLIAMLGQAGITAHPVLADFDHRIDPAVPTHYANHMIVAIEVPADVKDSRLQSIVPWNGKRLLIFDPTNPVAGPGALESELQGSWGVLLAGAQTTPLRLPELAAPDSQLQRTGRFTLSADGALSGEVQETRTGSTADMWRAFAIRGDQRKLQEKEETRVRDMVPGSTLGDLTVDAAHDRDQPLRLRFHMEAPNYTRQAGSMLMLRLAVLRLDQGQNLEDGQPRLYPIEMGAKRELREQYTITLPAGYKALDLPDPVSIETPFAQYHAAVTGTGATLQYNCELVIVTSELPADARRQYEDFFNGVAAADSAAVLLTTSR